MTGGGEAQPQRNPTRPGAFFSSPHLEKSVDGSLRFKRGSGLGQSHHRSRRRGCSSSRRSAHATWVAGLAYQAPVSRHCSSSEFYPFGILC